MVKKLANIALILILLVAFIGIPVTKSICNMEFCEKECKMRCCSGENDNSCEQRVEYAQIDSDLSNTETLVKIPTILLFQTELLFSKYNPISVLNNKHSEYTYNTPLTTIDIPIRVRCFRI